MKENMDVLDNLLKVAATSVGKNDIREFCEENRSAEFSDEFLKKFKEVPQKATEKATKKVKRIRFRQRIIAAAVAALLVCALMVGSIADFGRTSAKPKVEFENGKSVLSYGFKSMLPGKFLPNEIPQVIGDGCRLSGRTEFSDGYSEVYCGETAELTYTVRKLNSSYSLVLGDENTDCFKIFICEKYNGIAAESVVDGEIYSVVAWNDGNVAYELCGNISADELIFVAEGLY